MEDALFVSLPAAITLAVALVAALLLLLLQRRAWLKRTKRVPGLLLAAQAVMVPLMGFLLAAIPDESDGRGGTCPALDGGWGIVALAAAIGSSVVGGLAVAGTIVLDRPLVRRPLIFGVIAVALSYVTWFILLLAAVVCGLD